MADIDLPVWSIPPNWSTPVTERLEWLTDVLQSRSLAEQRRAVRLTPRRFFEFVINPVDAVRSLFDQWMHRISDEPCLLPLWHDHGRLTDTALTAATRLDLDTRWMDFVDGGLALLYYNPFKYEAVEIAAIDDTGLDLAAGLAGDWPEGTSIYPLRRALADTDLTLASLTSRVGESTVSFMVDGDNAYDDGAESLTTHDGYPLVTLEPNRMDPLEQQFGRVLDELDLQLGRVRRYDENTRSYQTQFYNWKAQGRQQHHELRQTLYRLNGRQKGVWMPSFNRDIVLAADLDVGAGSIDIEKIGYHLLGGVIAGRDRVLLRDNTGTNRVLKFDGSADVSTTVEQLSLDANATFEADTGKFGSFLSLVRLDQDTVEIVHHTDSAGVCEVSAAFKSFSPARVAPSILLAAEPAAVESSASCGTASDDACPIYFAEFDGWDLEFFLKITYLKRVGVQGFYLHRPVEFGGALGGGSGYGGALGSDWSTTAFPTAEPGIAWTGRRVNAAAANGRATGVNTESLVGTWHATIDIGIVNFFREPPPLNVINLYLYVRAWNQPFGGSETLVWSKENIMSNNDYNVDVPITFDWRDFRP
jgi:hypothetical protein